MSMIWWGVTSRSLRRLTARARQGWRRAVTGALGGTGFVLVVAGAEQHTAHAQHLWMAGALPFAAAAVGWQVWRAPEEGLPDALRLRERSRRIGLRTASVPGFGASVGLVVHLGAHGALAHQAGVAALWAVAAAPVPVLAEGALWAAAPRRLRLQVRTARIAEAVREVNSGVGRLSQLAFDPEAGYAGAPVPHRSLAPADHLGAAREARPTREQTVAMLGLSLLNRAHRTWIREASLRWDGEALILTDGRRNSVAVPHDGTRRPGHGRLADRPVELVWLREQAPGEPGWQIRLLLLDASGRRLLTMPGLGFLYGEMAAVAAASGLRFTFHNWAGAPPELPGRRLWTRVFPRRRGHVRLRMARRL
ncbi:hypothetical protein [Streptacidiphilus anmyonensis]|uniref:hypothetical protein n=1 Tax=Streptacidiphilus anmyonensis TaxID=405782 RepID=UPI0005A90C61|nr:hypothetical protein [Streptacidiphilus anmyonensis]